MNTPQSAAISCAAVTFTYPAHQQPALRAIDLEIAPGELVVVVGPSGCGKSTLLRLIAGLLHAEQGTICFDGSAIDDVPPERRRVGWVPQSYALFEHLSVAGNIAFGMRMQRMAAAARARRVRELLELCQISELGARAISDLSGGQRQRVAIARALAIAPRVLLLDEPLAALDPQLRAELRGKLVELLRTSGITTLFVTHDQREALSIADRIVVLRGGVVAQIGTPEQLWQQPASAFVAQFISDATIIDARRLDDARIELAPGMTALAAMPPPTAIVQAVLRAEDVQQHAAGASAVVTGSAFAGAYYLVRAQLVEGPAVAFHSATTLAAGAPVRLAVRPDVRIAVVA